MMIERYTPHYHDDRDILLIIMMIERYTPHYHDDSERCHDSLSCRHVLCPKGARLAHRLAVGPGGVEVLGDGLPVHAVRLASLEQIQQPCIACHH